MRCPYCSKRQTFVVDSRDTNDGDSIRRRRQCKKCKRRFTTYEKVEVLDLKVVKKNGDKESFDREKIKRGLIKATFKRPISVEQIDNLIQDVVQDLCQKETKEIKSWEIGNMVIERLKKIDNLSYLLFATIYRDFSSIEEFERELEKLKK
jgi:transcriptional repressor NrdR